MPCLFCNLIFISNHSYSIIEFSGTHDFSGSYPTMLQPDPDLFHGPSNHAPRPWPSYGWLKTAQKTDTTPVKISQHKLLYHCFLFCAPLAMHSSHCLWHIIKTSVTSAFKHNSNWIEMNRGCLTAGQLQLWVTNLVLKIRSCDHVLIRSVDQCWYSTFNKKIKLKMRKNCLNQRRGLVERSYGALLQ